jgi:hypothetical protein
MFEEVFSQIDDEFKSGKSFIELTNDSLIIHE